MCRLRYALLPVIILFFAQLPLLHGKVLRVEIESRELVLGGRSWGGSGAYELLRGKVYYGFDPGNLYNRRITDLALAPRNADGLVEAWGDLVVLQPVDPALRRGVALVEVSNRGGKFSPAYFNRAARGSELVAGDPDYWGDGLLMRQGLTVIWAGWQFDVPDREHILKLHVPTATQPDGQPITGWVRSDWTMDEPANSLSLGHREQRGYPATDLNGSQHVLTVRDGRDAPRQFIPREQWRFAREVKGEPITDDTHIYLDGGFQAGKIYELVYQAANPPVVGLGLAAIRDIIAYAKYGLNCPFPARYGIAAGVSQTGRFLRHFLYQGFNTEETGRPAYDGMMIITAGAGRGSFNHRFAQPSRDAHRYSAFFYPTDIFPFTSQPQTDPLTGLTDGLLDQLFDNEHIPKAFYINTGYEYWGRSASLIHSSLDGRSDVAPLRHERIYHIASGQHFVDRWPPREPAGTEGVEQYRGNPLEFRPNYRALLVRLIEWVEKDQAPPDSRYPRIGAKQLVSKEELAFPAIPGVEVPAVMQHPYRADYGPRWRQGIIDKQPPQLGYAFPALVPQVDTIGNEMGGIGNVEIRVPLATYTPWSLRGGLPGPAFEMSDFRGLFIPLPLTEAQRRENGDPRPSVASLYRNAEAYLEAAGAAARSLVADGFLLPEDTGFVRDRAVQRWEWLHRPADSGGLTRGPGKGSLLIIGGGRLDSIFYQKFMELAGGPEAPIVVIPTAGEDSFFEQDSALIRLKASFTRRGFQNVTILHTRDRDEADTEAFAAPLRQARGVWLGGGRQWRLADSYLHTRTHEALKGLLDRGGVIAGTSAGATIQGSYLARGDTRGNTLMMGDHEEGLGFVTNIAIDQHLLARNRQFDLFEILDHHPELLGIGLDENTGILVQGDRFEVMGASYVAVFDGKKYAPERRAYFPLKKGDRRFYLLRAGDKYDLNRREVLPSGQ